TTTGHDRPMPQGDHVMKRATPCLIAVGAIVLGSVACSSEDEPAPETTAVAEQHDTSDEAYSCREACRPGDKEATFGTIGTCLFSGNCYRTGCELEGVAPCIKTAEQPSTCECPHAYSRMFLTPHTVPANCGQMLTCDDLGLPPNAAPALCPRK